jgi:hypothetical protein
MSESRSFCRGHFGPIGIDELFPSSAGKASRQSPSQFNASSRSHRYAVGIDAQMPKDHVCGMLFAKIKPFARHQIGLQKNGQRVLIGYVI